MKKLRVAINISCLSTPKIRGIARYTTNLLKYLQKENIELILISYGQVFKDHLHNVEYYQLDEDKKMNYFLWEQYYLPKKLKSFGVELYHAPANYGVPLLGSFTKVVTIHDIIDFKLNQKLPWKFRLLSFLARHYSSHIITVSHYSKNDLVDFFDVDEKKISVIYEASDLPTNQASQSPVIKGQYFFYLGGWEKRKNILFLLAAFKKASLEDYTLVLAGEKNPEARQVVIDYIEENNIENVKLLEWVEEDDIPNLYQNARAFIYPSFYEGFGLQLCEAMNYDVPVLSSNVTSLPEILNNPQATFSPEKPEELATLLKKLAHNDDFFKTLKQHSLQRKLFFSWEKMARETYTLYEKLK